jgi:hypothetical protein
MSARRRKMPTPTRQSRHRIVPVWRTEIDREAFAKALLLLVLHLDETERDAHKQTEKTNSEGREE